MTLPLNTVVNADIIVTPTPLAQPGFGILAFASHDADGVIPDAERIRMYANMSGVEADFTVGTEVNKAASAYFAQSPTPVGFAVVGIYGTATPAVLLGGAPALLATLQAITSLVLTVESTDDGGLPISTVYDGADFSGASSLSDIAGILNLIGGVDLTVTTDGTTFDIDTVAVGLLVTITEPSAGDADALGLSTIAGATVTTGTDEETPAYALSQANLINSAFYGVAIDKVFRDSDDAVAVGTWASAQTKVFFNCSNDEGSIVQGNTSCIFFTMKSFNRVLPVYSSFTDEYPECSIAGRAFTVEFEGTNTTITLMFKQMPTISIEQLTTAQYNALRDKNGNAFISVAGNPMFAEGSMNDGTWFDVIHGTDWLTSFIEQTVFASLYSIPKVPYTDQGTAILEAALALALQQAVVNGMAAPGISPTGEFLELGYIITAIPVADVSPAIRGTRRYNGLGFEILGSGAIHGANIVGTFVAA
jgi:hypothetical protein